MIEPGRWTCEVEGVEGTSRPIGCDTSEQAARGAALDAIAANQRMFRRVETDDWRVVVTCRNHDTVERWGVTAWFSPADAGLLKLPRVAAERLP